MDFYYAVVYAFIWVQMKTKTVSKQIGKVRVFEFHGNLVGIMARQCYAEMEKIMNGINDPICLLINALHVEALDGAAAKTFLDHSKRVDKSVLITRNPFMVEALFRADPDHRMMIFERETDAVFYLSKEFTEAEGEERRLYPRLKIGIPVHVHYRSKEQKPSSLFCIATNLSQKGMFAVLMDDASEMELKRNFDIYDLPMLEFVIRFSPDQLMKIKGKIIHFNPEQSGFGVEFYEVNQKDLNLLDGFIRQQENSQV